MCKKNRKTKNKHEDMKDQDVSSASVVKYFL